MTGSADVLTGPGKLEKTSYTITYQGTEFQKEAYVYVPSAYDGTAMNILYLMHGSQGSGKALAEDMAPLLDKWIQEGEIKPLLVVFPTYYPDRSFVVPDYSRDYPLNHFFATEELLPLMRAVEGTYRTYAEGTDEAGLAAGRTHRAFGGYSMGGVTTWDVLAYQSMYFSDFMPMAGDCWLDRVTDASGDTETADLLMQGLSANGFTANDFRIIAMVGENDGTKYSMQPQIAALRNDHADLIRADNLIYWENARGGHSEESLEAEVEHGIPYLFSHAVSGNT
jgi:enterochelin esterase-like enzyme